MPLVLKSDNGPAFVSAEVRAVLAERGVVALYSPPYWPRYNGAIEAGIGALREKSVSEVLFGTASTGSGAPATEAVGAGAVAE